MSLSPEQYRKIGVAAAKSAGEKKAEEILLLDLRKTPNTVSDFLLILSANSQVHLKTLRDAVEESLEKMNLRPVHSDGVRSEQWSVLDYGGLLVHIFHRDARKFYSLERQWESPKKITWEPKKAALKPKIKSKPAKKK